MTQQLAILLIIITGIVLIGIVLLLLKFYQQNGRLLSENRQFQSSINDHAQALFQDRWARECESIRTDERNLAMRDANSSLQQWKVEEESSIRNDALRRSLSVIIGQVTGHIAPYMPSFAFNPKDVRFIGSPIDLLVFDGLSDERIDKIVFVEVKTGPSPSLTNREKHVKEAVIVAGIPN